MFGQIRLNTKVIRHTASPSLMRSTHLHVVQARTAGRGWTMFQRTESSLVCVVRSCSVAGLAC